MGTRCGEKAARVGSGWAALSSRLISHSFCSCESTSCTGERLPGGESKVAPCMSWMALDWMNVGNWFPPMQKEEGVWLSPDNPFSSQPHLVWRWGWSVPRRAPGSLSCFPVLPGPARSGRGGGAAGLRVGICCGWEGGSVWNCKDEFFRPGRVGHRGCLHAAGRPLAQWSNTFLRACCCMQGCCLPCLAWLRAGRLAPGGEMLSPSCSLGSEGEEVKSPGCFWEKSSLMWGACFSRLALCHPYSLFSFLPAFTSRAYWCGRATCSPLISAQGLSPAAGCSGEPLASLLHSPFGSKRSHPVTGRWMGLQSKALAAMRALRGIHAWLPGVPCPAFRACPTVSGSSEGVVQTRR